MYCVELLDYYIRPEIGEKKLSFVARDAPARTNPPPHSALRPAGSPGPPEQHGVASADLHLNMADLTGMGFELAAG